MTYIETINDFSEFQIADSGNDRNHYQRIDDKIFLYIANILNKIDLNLEKIAKEIVKLNGDEKK